MADQFKDSRASSGSPKRPGATRPSRLSPAQDPRVLSVDSLAKYLDEWSSFSQEMMGVLDKVLEIGVDGEQIIDFQTGDLTQEEIMEMYNEPKK